jgi:hypothetical protein
MTKAPAAPEGRAGAGVAAALRVRRDAAALRVRRDAGLRVVFFRAM